MARQEQDREDLLREAIALVERMEVETASEAQSVVVGFRRDGAASVYFGADPAYHFNTRDELRRAFVDGQLWKAEQRRLIAMHRERAAREVRLESREMAVEAQSAAVQTLRERLRILHQDLSSQERYKLIGQVPAEANVLARVLNWLEKLPLDLVISERPNVA